MRRNYGRGWLPFRQRPTVLVCFTSAQNTIIRRDDGGFDVIPDLVFPKRAYPGENLDSEWWDWSTRIFIGRLKFPGMGKTQGIKQTSIEKIHSQCHSDAITVWNTLTSTAQIDKWLRCIWKDFCMKRVLLAEFSDVSNNVNPSAWTVHRDMFIVPKGPKNIPGERYQGVWPFPEGYPVSPKLTSLCPRKPYPLIRLQQAKEHEMINLPNDPNLGRFPIDTYEVISAKYFNFITRSPGIRYCMYVFDSLRERQVGKPFGYMYYDSSKEKLYMVLGPYDYPWLFQHLHCFSTNSKKGWSAGISLLNWRSAMEAYLLNIPPYYVDIILSEMCKLELGLFIPKLKRPSLSQSVSNHLIEVDMFWRTRDTKNSSSKLSRWKKSNMQGFTRSLKATGSRRAHNLERLQDLRQKVVDEINGFVRSPEESDELLVNDAAHNLPIALMGSMQYYKMKKNRLKAQIDEFRNPFDLNEKSRKITVFGGNPYRKVRRKSAYPQTQFTHKRADLSEPPAAKRRRLMSDAAAKGVLLFHVPKALDKPRIGIGVDMR